MHANHMLRPSKPSIYLLALFSFLVILEIVGLKLFACLLDCLNDTVSLCKMRDAIM